jgi:tetratricopeptide (TPR) repeat protein
MARGIALAGALSGSLWLGACASPTAGGSSAAQATPVTPGARVVDPLPEVELTPPLLFQIMAAEIALQRGAAGDAYSAFMAAAAGTHDPRLARRALDVALAGGAPREALESARAWHDFAPHDPDAARGYASLLVANGHFDAARPLLQDQLAAAAQPLDYLEGLAHVVQRTPDALRAQALLGEVAAPLLAAPASAPAAHLVLARSALAATRNESAVQHARAALQARPDDEAVLLAAMPLLAQAQAAIPQAPPAAGSARGEAPASEALAAYERHLEAHPQAAAVRLAYARQLVSEGRLEPARVQFERLEKEAPEQIDALFALGVLALDAEQYEQADAYLQRYLAAAARDPGRDLSLVFLNLGRAAEGQRRYAQALEWLQRVTPGEQADAAHEQQAFVLGRLGRVEEGLALLRALPQASNEQRVRAVLDQGQLLRDARRLADSYEVLRAALASMPEDPGLLYETAMSAERLDHLDVMERHLRHLLRLRPDFAHAYNALGYSLADRNIRLPEALDLIGRAMALAPGDGFIVDSLGWVQFRMGDLVAARETLTRAFRIKADPDVAAHLGEVLWASGEQQAARSLLLEARRRDGDSDTLRETMQRLKIEP